MRTYAIILASGAGTRAGGDLPKQFREVAGRPVFYRSMLAFSRACPDTRIVAVVHPDWLDRWKAYWKSLPEEEHIPHMTTIGGATRIDSVEMGLRAVNDWESLEKSPAEGCCNEDPLVAVHDSARLLVTPDLIERGFALAKSGSCAAVPAVPVSDSLRQLPSEAGGYSRPVDRTGFVAVQTPQIAPLSWLLRAYSSLSPDARFTDDASILQEVGFPVELYVGDPSNIKLTYPYDFITAEAILLSRSES